MKAILIADDHEVTRRGLRELLRESFDGVEVIEVGDGGSAIAQLPARSWGLMILDVRMPGPNVIDLIATIRAHSPSVPILILTAATEIEYCIQTLKAGANGVIHKHRVVNELITAIQHVLAGDAYMHPETALAVAAALREDGKSPPHHKLSRRELEIFQMIARGRAVKEVAGDLELSEKTVATYVARIREKTGLSSYVEMTRYALQHKLVE